MGESNIVEAACTSNEWRLTSVGGELGEDAAHVWRAALDQLAAMIAKLAPLLSKDKYQKAMRYYRIKATYRIRNWSRYNASLKPR
jgi:hypothetical protein